MEASRQLKVGDQNFQIKRISAELGAWILNIMMSAMFKLANSDDGAAQHEESQIDPVEKANEIVAAMWISASTVISPDTYKQIQRYCLQACNIEIGGNPVPLVDLKGRWAAPELETNLPVVNQLIVETLQFNISPFFIESALKNKREAATALKSS